MNQATSRLTKVPWKCEHCGAKYLVSITQLGADGDPPNCQKCGRTMPWTSTRGEIEPLFDADISANVG